MKKILKNYFKKFIQKIADENSKSFGSGKLDCCGLNKTNNATKKSDAKDKQ